MLQFSFIDNANVNANQIPPRKINGGLYTGEPAVGAWGNVPIVPQSEILIDSFYNLQLSQTAPPEQMKYQAISTIRPGNNHVEFPNHKMCTVMNFNSLCAK